MGAVLVGAACKNNGRDHSGGSMRLIVYVADDILREQLLFRNIFSWENGSLHHEIWLDTLVKRIYLGSC